MSDVAQQVLAHAASMPESASLSDKALLHLSSCAAVEQALSRLARTGVLLRAGRGVYVLPVKSKFGAPAPGVAQGVPGVGQPAPRNRRCAVTRAPAKRARRALAEDDQRMMDDGLLLDDAEAFKAFGARCASSFKVMSLPSVNLAESGQTHAFKSPMTRP